MTDRFPFDHLTLAEVAELERITFNREPSGTLPKGSLARFRYLAARRRPPLYDPPPKDAA